MFILDAFHAGTIAENVKTVFVYGFFFSVGFGLMMGLLLTLYNLRSDKREFLTEPLPNLLTVEEEIREPLRKGYGNQS